MQNRMNSLLQNSKHIVNFALKKKRYQNTKYSRNFGIDIKIYIIIINFKYIYKIIFKFYT